MTCPGLHCPGCGRGGRGRQVLMLAAVVAAAGLAEWVFARLWWLLGAAAVSLAIALYVVWRLVRWQQRREAAWGAQRAAQLTTGPVLQVPQADRRVITGGVTLNFYNLDPVGQAAVIRKALSDGPRG